MIKASCLCQTVKFDISAEMTDICQCHCSKCRKVTGTASNAVVLVPSSGLTWVSGEESIATYRMDDGWHNNFCRNCGSPLPISDPEGNTFWVHVGLLDDDPSIKVSAHIYVGSKAEWDEISGEVIQFQEGIQ